MSTRSIAVARSYRGCATRPASFCRAPLWRAAGSGIGSTFVRTSFSLGIGKGPEEGPEVVSNIIGQERHDLWLAGFGWSAVAIPCLQANQGSLRTG